MKNVIVASEIIEQVFDTDFLIEEMKIILKPRWKNNYNNS
jgi:hypothetical protein